MDQARGAALGARQHRRGSAAIRGASRSPASRRARSPSARRWRRRWRSDLIAGAIGESGAFFSTTISTPTRAETEQIGVAFAQKRRRADSRRAARAVGHRAARDGGPPGHAAVRPERGRLVLPRGAGQHLRSPASRRRCRCSPDGTREEMNARAVLQETPTPENVKRAARAALPGARAEEAAKVFPASTPEEALQSVTDLAGDRFIGFSTWKWLEVHAKTSGKPVYRYLYARPRPPHRRGGRDAEPRRRRDARRQHAACTARARRGALGRDRVRDGQPRDEQGVRLDRRRPQGLADDAGLLRELHQDGQPERRRDCRTGRSARWTRAATRSASGSTWRRRRSPSRGARYLFQDQVASAPRP